MEAIRIVSDGEQLVMVIFNVVTGKMRFEVVTDGED